jgi:hypothetical protein
MEIDLILDEKYFTSDFYNRQRKKDKLYDIYINPTSKEVQKFVPSIARAWVDTKGNLYVEGVPLEDQSSITGESEKYFAPEHVEFVHLIFKTNGLRYPKYNFYADFHMGYPAYLVKKEKVYIAYMVEPRILKMDNKIHELSLYMKKAQKKNPNLQFLMKRGG